MLSQIYLISQSFYPYIWRPTQVNALSYSKKCWFQRTLLPFKFCNGQIVGLFSGNLTFFSRYFATVAIFFLPLFPSTCASSALLACWLASLLACLPGSPPFQALCPLPYSQTHTHTLWLSAIHVLPSVSYYATRFFFSFFLFLSGEYLNMGKVARTVHHLHTNEDGHKQSILSWFKQ